MQKLTQTPWFQIPTPCFKRPGKAVVVGGGIAGTTVAYALAEKGLQVTLLERESELATQASGNPAGIILPHLAIQPNPMSRFLLAAYKAVLQEIHQMNLQGLSTGWNPLGVIHLLTTDRLNKLYETLPQLQYYQDIAIGLSPGETKEKSGINLSRPSLYYPGGGYLNPRLFCDAFARRLSIEIRYYRQAVRLEKDFQNWLVFDEDERLITKADILVLANGKEAAAIAQTCTLPFIPTRGQLTFVPKNMIQPAPKTVICHDGYFIPNLNGVHLLGATWSPEKTTTLSEADQKTLINNLIREVPALSIKGSPPLQGRASHRTQSPDHLPMVGPVPDFQNFLTTYNDLHHGKPGKTYPKGPYHEGLYISAAHGARGLVSAWASAQILAAQITDQTPPFEQDLVNAVNPARFLIRQLKKKPEDRPQHLRLF